MNEKRELVLSSLRHTWIFDIDGTIVKHNGYKLNGEDTLLSGVKDFFQAIPEEDMIILLTSRTVESKEQTEEFLKKNKIRFDHIIYHVPYGERILYNDNKPSGLRMAYSVCLARDEGLQTDFIIKEDC